MTEPSAPEPPREQILTPEEVRKIGKPVLARVRAAQALGSPIQYARGGLIPGHGSAPNAQCRRQMLADGQTTVPGICMLHGISGCPAPIHEHGTGTVQPELYNQLRDDASRMLRPSQLDREAHAHLLEAANRLQSLQMLHASIPHPDGSGRRICEHCTELAGGGDVVLCPCVTQVVLDGGWQRSPRRNPSG